MSPSVNQEGFSGVNWCTQNQTFGRGTKVALLGGRHFIACSANCCQKEMMMMMKKWGGEEKGERGGGREGDASVLAA